MGDIGIFEIKAILYMMNRLAYFVVLLVAAMLAGCTSHAPSAAQFMNVKKNGNSIALGGAIWTGDVHHGTYRYESDFTDKENAGDFDLNYFHRFNSVVIGMYSVNALSLNYVTGVRSQYFALQGWLGGAINAVDHVTPFYGGLMLIEEYPVTDNFRAGLSEHVSRNAYDVDENWGGICCVAAGFYNEFGAGAYLAYSNFSFEFRYGREIDEPRNRFYFMANYAFTFGGKSSRDQNLLRMISPASE